MIFSYSGPSFAHILAQLFGFSIPPYETFSND